MIGDTTRPPSSTPHRSPSRLTGPSRPRPSFSWRTRPASSGPLGSCSGARGCWSAVGRGWPCWPTAANSRPPRGSCALVNPLGRIPDAAPLRGTKSGNISPPLRSHSRGLASKQVCGELGDRRGRWGPGFQRLARISKGFAVRRAQGESSLMKSRVTRCVLIDERRGGPGATHISPGVWRGTLWTD